MIFEFNFNEDLDELETPLFDLNCVIRPLRIKLTISLTSQYFLFYFKILPLFTKKRLNYYLYKEHYLWVKRAYGLVTMKDLDDLEEIPFAITDDLEEFLVDYSQEDSKPIINNTL